ncbi:MAG: hypothetical protein ACHQQS_13460 [Thermoanaerobaculales bacterium]
MAHPLHIAVLASATWALAVLTASWLQARAYGKRLLFARAAGDRTAGIRYAFSTSMLPQAKESVMMHLPSYLAGIAFHLGTFAAFGLLAVSVVSINLPVSARWLACVVTLAGAIGGLALLAKRIATPHLRGLSAPDDFVANVLTTTFVALAGATVLVAALRNVWLVAASLLLFYLPIGKIRHCLFFFSTRAHLGAFFGYRGVLPPSRSQEP